LNEAKDIKSDYLQELVKLDISTLPIAYEHELGHRIQAGDEEAFEELVNHNLRLVPYMVSSKMTAWHHGKTPLEDLIGMGNEALLLSARKWKPKKGVRFSSYACAFIRQFVLRELNNTENVIRLPVNIMLAIKKMRYEERVLSQILGRAPTVTELAKVLNVSTARIHQLRGYLAREPISLDSLESEKFNEENEE
jgi:DNA-directed RNA polymerase sigma subunit (sigma70/sigma32)